jgi:hypothetical protein
MTPLTWFLLALAAVLITFLVVHEVSIYRHRKRARRRGGFIEHHGKTRVGR